MGHVLEIAVSEIVAQYVLAYSRDEAMCGRKGAKRTPPEVVELVRCHANTSV
jgi:hypothetical protein